MKLKFVPFAWYSIFGNSSADLALYAGNVAVRKTPKDIGLCPIISFRECSHIPAN